METETIVQLVAEGNNTTTKLSDALGGTDRATVNRYLRDAMDAGELARHREGRQYVYTVADGETETETETAATDAEEDADPAPEVEHAPADSLTAAPTVEPAPEQEADDTGLMRVNGDRNYDFAGDIPTGIPEYIPHDTELAKINATLAGRYESGMLPHFRVGGPTKCGKTHLARYIAQERDAPLFTIQGTPDLHGGDLLGMPIVVGDGETTETVWQDGPLTKALLASQEGEVVVLFDEANRAPPQAKGVFFSALDDRASVTLDGRGGETVEGEPLNLIVVSTINQGAGYFVERLDVAEKGRLGNTFNVDYLGYHSDPQKREENAEKEAGLIRDRTPVAGELADDLVAAANNVRRDAKDQSNTTISTGIPTGSLLTWAQTAVDYDDAEISNPVLEAGKDAIVKVFYDEDQSETDAVVSTMTSMFDGAPADEDGYDRFKHPEKYSEDGEEVDQDDIDEEWSFVGPDE